FFPLHFIDLPGRDLHLFPTAGLILKGWHEQMPHPILELLMQGWVSMHRPPDILSIAPHMVGQANGHRWRTRCAALAQAPVRHHKVVEANHKPDLPAVAGVAPR